MILALAAAYAAPFVRTERVDLVSEASGAWILEDVPRLGIAPRNTALRWIEQISFAAEIPRFSLVLSASVASQSVSWRKRFSPRAPIYGSLGVTTRLGLPRGVLVGAETWAGPVRLGLGVHVHSTATWARPNFTHWRVYPGLGIGLGRPPKVF